MWGHQGCSFVGTGVRTRAITPPLRSRSTSLATSACHNYCIPSSRTVAYIWRWKPRKAWPRPESRYAAFHALSKPRPAGILDLEPRNSISEHSSPQSEESRFRKTRRARHRNAVFRTIKCRRAIRVRSPSHPLPSCSPLSSSQLWPLRQASLLRVRYLHTLCLLPGKTTTSSLPRVIVPLEPQRTLVVSLRRLRRSAQQYSSSNPSLGPSDSLTQPFVCTIPVRDSRRLSLSLHRLLMQDNKGSTPRSSTRISPVSPSLCV